MDELKGNQTDVPHSDIESEMFIELGIDSIIPNTYQPRKSFDEGLLVALTNSIREMGVLQPILVRDGTKENTYELIAGERRWRAARRAGLKKIPAIVRSVENVVSLEQAIVENLHRSDLNPIEEAIAYENLVSNFNFNHSRIASRVGKSRSAVANILRLLQLPLRVQKFLREGKISAGHARALLMLDNPNSQLSLAEIIIAEEYSVRMAEEKAQKMKSNLLSPKPKLKNPHFSASPAAYVEVESSLSEIFDTNVSVESVKGRGRLVLEFADDADLGRIFDLLNDTSV